MNHLDQIERFEALAGIQARTERLERLLGRYELSQEEKEAAAEKLLFAKSKENQMLRIAVAGEFSAGKSSFINALMRERLLEEGAAAGTTLLSVIVSYGEKKGLSLLGKDENRLSGDFCASGSAEMQQMIRGFNAGMKENTPETYLLLTVPSEFLKNGISLIDTPGANSLEYWHDQSARRTITAKAQGAVILICATHPLSESLCGFIENDFPFRPEQCVFLVTKMDLLRPNEREKQLAYIADRIRRKLGVRDPLVLPYSSVDVLEDGELKEQSMESERKLLAFFGERRLEIHMEKRFSALLDVCGILKNAMARVSGKSGSPAGKSENERKKSLGAFTEEASQRLLEEFGRRAGEIWRSLSEKCGEICAVNENTADQSFHAAKSLSAVKNSMEYCRSRFASRVCREASEELSKACGALSEAYSEALREFEKLLFLEYPKIEMIEWSAIQMNLEGIGDCSDLSRLSEANEWTRYIKKKKKKSALLYWIPLLVLLAVNLFSGGWADWDFTLIFAVGCLIVAVYSGLFGAGHFIRRKRAVEKAKQSVEPCYSEAKRKMRERLQSKLKKAFDSNSGAIRSRLFHAMNRFSDRYGFGYTEETQGVAAPENGEAEERLREDIRTLEFEEREIGLLRQLISGEKEGEENGQS